MKHQIGSLNVMVTNQCPLRCAHCGPRSGPWAKGALDVEIIFAALDEARARACRVVNFTGGEPFILGATLVELVRAAAGREMIARITTGAYWSTSAEAAARRLEPLAGAGLRQLFISCSDAHQSFVPFANVIEAARSARRFGIEVYLTLGTSQTSATGARSVREAFEAAGVQTPWLTESPLIPFGRAEETLPLADMLLQPVENFTGPCPSLTMNPTIRADGQITGCAVVFGAECPSLSFGNVEGDSLGQALDRMHDDLLVAWIHKVGVVELKDLIEANSSIRFADRYVNICHLCGDILSNPEALALLQTLGLARALSGTPA
jgi:MoaA/NifB/PqqE/SkfB family radical SAM enzyme